MLDYGDHDYAAAPDANVRVRDREAERMEAILPGEHDPPQVIVSSLIVPPQTQTLSSGTCQLRTAAREGVQIGRRLQTGYAHTLTVALLP